MYRIVVAFVGYYTMYWWVKIITAVLNYVNYIDLVKSSKESYIFGSRTKLTEYFWYEIIELREFILWCIAIVFIFSTPYTS